MMHRQESEPGTDLLEKAQRLELNGNFHEAADNYAQLEKLYADIGNKEKALRYLVDQGWILLHKCNDTEGAYKKYIEAEQLCKEVKGRKPLTLILHDLAYIFFQKGDQKNALWRYREYMVRKKSDEQYAQFQLVMSDGDVMKPDSKTTKNITREMVQYDELERLEKEVKDTEFKSSVLYVKALELVAEKKDDEAIEKCAEYVSLKHHIGEKTGIVGGLELIGKLMVRQERFAKALEVFKDQVSWCQESGNMNALKGNLKYQAFLLTHKLRNYEEAYPKQLAYEKICREMNDEQGLAGALRDLIWIQSEKRGDLSDAMVKSKELEALAIKLGMKEVLKESLQIQISVHKSWGEKKEAKSKEKELKEISD